MASPIKHLIYPHECLPVKTVHRGLTIKDYQRPQFNPTVHAPKTSSDSGSSLRHDRTHREHIGIETVGI